MEGLSAVRLKKYNCNFLSREMNSMDFRFCDHNNYYYVSGWLKLFSYMNLKMRRLYCFVEHELTLMT